MDQNIENLLEALADIAYDMGFRKLLFSNDSRERISRIIQWAKEFQQAHENTEWCEEDYMEKIEAFVSTKIKECFVNVARPCPNCGKESSLICEAPELDSEYFSLQCYKCGQFWEGADALSALSGVKSWDKEIIGEDARAVLRTLLLDIEPDRRLFDILEHPTSYCRGVYQDSDKFVAFDNTRGECFVEEFKTLNTAVLWMRGEIQASERFKYE